MKGKFKKFIVIGLMTVCVVACLSLGMANMKTSHEDFVSEDSIADTDPGIETYTIYNGQSDWDVEYVDGRYLITWYHGSSKTPTVPYIEVDEDHYVTGIGDKVFYNDSITSITLNSSISYIGDYAFYGCDKLTTVTGTEYVSHVGSHAFCGCSALTTLTIFDGNVGGSGGSIGDYAFYKCSSIETFSIPNWISTIGDYAFYNCTGITELSIGTSVTSIGAHSFHNLLYLSSLTIPSNVKTIGDEAFISCWGLTTLYFNATSMDDLSSDASIFGYLGGRGSGVTVTIGSNVTRIPAYLFGLTGSSTINITTVKFENNSKCVSIGDYAFQNCTSLNSLTFPDGLETIGDYAFYGCTSLTSVSFPDSIESIGKYAFNTTSLVSMSFGVGLKYVGNQAFNYLSGSVLSLYITDVASWCAVEFADGGSAPVTNSGKIKLYLNGTLVENLVIPDGVETIGAYTFRYTSIKSVTISDSVTTIGSYAFDDCYSLTAVTMGKNVTKLGRSSFLYCESLKEITLSSSLITIGSYAFEYCSSLTSIIIPDSVTEIGSYAFYKCTALESVIFDDQRGWYCSKCDFGVDDLKDASTAAKYLTSTYYTVAWYKNEVSDFEYTLSSDGKYYILVAYSGKSNEVIIESTYESLPVKEIASSVFEGHTEITSVTISENITTIGDYAFSGCTYVTTIYFNATSMKDLSSKNGVFYNTGKYGSGITVTVGAGVTRIPAYLFNSYNSTSYAPNITSVIFESGSKCAFIGDYVFGYCTSLTSFSVPDGVTSIGAYAFYNCSKLTSVTIGESVTSIGGYAFSYCTTVSTIYFNATSMNNLSSSSYIFLSTGTSGSGITVTIGANVTRIPAYLFYSNSVVPYITTVIFESGGKCTEIGESAFYRLNRFTKLYVDDLASFLSMDFADRYANPLSVVSANGGTFYVDESKTTALTAKNTSGVTRIGSYALAYCTIISDIVIGENVSYIGNNAFEGMSGLDSFALASCSGWSVYASGSSSGTKIAATDLQKNALEYFTSVYVAYTWKHTLTSTVAPVISSAVGNGDFTSVGFEVYVSVDSGSSIYCVYCVKPDGTVEYFYGMSSISVDSPMNGTYEIYAEDMEGTLSESYFIVFDDVAPKLYLGGGAAWANYNSSEFSVLALDNLDSDVRLWYSLTGENGSWLLCDSNPFTISPDETYSTDGRYWFVAVDAAGNVTGPYYTVLDAMPVEGYWERGDDMFYYFRYEAPSYSEWTCTVNGAAYVSGTPFTTDCTTYDIKLTGANGTSYELSQYLDHYFPEEGEYHEATCTEQAYTTYTCIYCGSYYTVYDPYSSAGDHNYVLELVEPTCTESGYSQYVCSDCGATTGFSYIAPLGHDWSNSEVSIEPTCTTNGFTGQICQRCGAQNEYGEVIPATGHNFVNDEDFYTAPTCTEKGRSRNVCLNCGEVGDVTETPALGHLLITETLPATCTEYGYLKTYCTREGCDYETSTSSDGYLASHTWSDEPVERRDATCTDDGCLVYVCTVCGERDERTISAFGHSYEIVTDSAKWTFPGTITIDGTAYKVIDSYWNDGEAYVVINRGGESDEVVPVWCKRCTVCGDTFLDYKTDAKETGNRVTEIFEKYQKYLWWILLALVVVWSLFIGLRWALQRNDQEKVKTRSMLANYVLGLFVIAVIIVGLPYLVYGIAILVG